MGRNLFDMNQEREDGINGTEARLPNESREQENSTNDAKGYDLFADFMPQSESIGYAFPAGVIPKRHKKPEWNDSTLPPLDLVTIFSTDLELTNAEGGIRTQKISRNLNEMAEAICRRFKFASISDSLAVYEPPCWKIMTSHEASRFIAKTVKGLFPDDAKYLSARQYGEIYFHILNHEDTIKREKIPAPDYHYLCCQDYLYNWKSGKCVAHDSSHLRFSTLAFDAKEIGNCSGEYWERFLEDLTDGADDLRQRILEVIGVILSGYPSKSFFLLEGESGTGKSQFANFLTDILGNDTCFALNDISQLGGNWTTGSLFGKLLCVCGDVPNAPLTSAAIGTIKQLTGGDLIRGEQKYKDAFTFENTAKLLFVSNYPLQIPKKYQEQALLDRLVVIPCRNPVPQNRQIPDLHKKLHEEAGYIVGLAMQALMELDARNGMFTPLPPVFETEVVQASDVEQDILDFVQNCCQFVDGASCKVVVLLAAFQEYTHNDTLSSMQFSKKIRELFPEIGRSKTKEARFLTGIKLRSGEGAPPVE